MGQALGVLALLALAGCAGFHQPSAAELQALLLAADPHVGGALAIGPLAGGAAPAAAACAGVVTIAAPRLAGTFDAALLVEPGPRGRARLQLFPDLGGKVLDVVACDERIEGVIPHASQHVRADPRAERLEAHLLAFAGVTLLELATPVTRSRVLGVRRAGTGYELRLAPRAAASEVVASVDAGGRVQRIALRAAGAAWSVTPGPPLVVEAPGFLLRATVHEQEPLPAPLADERFTLAPR